MKSNTTLYLLALLIGGVLSLPSAPTGGAGTDPGGSGGSSTTTTTTTKKNVAMPKPGKACKEKITFPFKKLTGVTGYPWIVEVFGIPLIATTKFKKSFEKKKSKLNHVASVLAALLDNDNDGCIDDPNVERNILEKYVPAGASSTAKGLKKSVILPDNAEISTDAATTAAEKIGYFFGQTLGKGETIPKCSGLKGTKTCVDAAIEELLHFVQNFGHTSAYNTVFGTGWNDISNLTKAMDIARGKRIMATPAKLSGYPTKAWYTYTDTTCEYGCQGMEYLWWGYCSYSGVCASRSGNTQYTEEFKLLKKADLKKTDKALYKLYSDSEAKTASYRLPTKPVDGTYLGCKTCKRTGAKSHGGT